MEDSIQSVMFHRRARTLDHAVVHHVDDVLTNRERILLNKYIVQICKENVRLRNRSMLDNIAKDYCVEMVVVMIDHSMLDEEITIELV